jgi:hypothetical protein
MPKLYLKATGIDKFEWVDTPEKASADAKESMEVTVKKFQGAKLEPAPRRSQQIEPGWIISVDASSPISLIQWLKAHEYRETKAALASYAEEVKIYCTDVSTKVQAEDALRTWSRDSAGNTQYCFIGAHGVEGPAGVAIGIGASGKATEFVDWQELWNWFEQGDLKGGLWLGACKSGDAAAALSPFLTSRARIAIPHIYGFSDPIYPIEIEQILSKLIEFTRINNFPWLDEELGQLRAAVPGTKIELFYPATTKDGTREYVNVDDMPDRVGLTFRQLLEREGSGHGR